MIPCIEKLAFLSFLYRVQINTEFSNCSQNFAFLIISKLVISSIMSSSCILSSILQMMLHYLIINNIAVTDWSLNIFACTCWMQFKDMPVDTSILCHHFWYYFCFLFLKMFNSRTCQLILGAGALHLVGLKNINTKNLGLWFFNWWNVYLKIYCMLSLSLIHISEPTRPY